MGGGGAGAGGFGHASHHHLHSLGPCVSYHFARLQQAGALHQLDIDAAVSAFDAGNILKTLNRLVGYNRKGTELGKPGRIIQTLLRQGLLDQHYPLLFKPADLVKSLAAVFPALIGIHGQRQVGDAADGAYHLFVAVKANFYFKNSIQTCALESLLAHYLRGIDSYCEGGRAGLGGVISPYTEERFPKQFAAKVVQGDVNRSFGRGVPFR